MSLVTRCLSVSPKDSYWYLGALGLRCWVANFTREFVLVEESANSLMTLDCGAGKHWFHVVREALKMADCA